MHTVSRFRVVLAASLLGGALIVSAPAAAVAVRSATTLTWSASTPGVPGVQITSLVAVTCVTSTDCWAVGDRYKASSSKSGPALIEHYDANRWSPTSASASQSGTLDELSGVSCLSAKDCWAVGIRSGSHSGNLLEHYEGTAWTAVSAPAPQGELSAVTCESSNGQCWAVGSANDFHVATTFHLIGNVWHYVRSAPLSVSFVQLNGVACATSDDCLLVGFTTPKHGAGQALAERWNGRGWSRVSIAGVLSGGGALEGIDCQPGSSPTTCWAVGQTVTKATGLIPIHPLVERWNGSSFALIHSPSGSAGNYPQLKAVACASSTACQAVGSRGSGQDEALVLTEGWNGSQWSGETSFSPLYGFQTLSGLACPSADDCWAVGEGQVRSFSGTRMIIEHFSTSS